MGHRSVAVALVVLLAACGGGGGSAPDPAPAPPSGLCATGVAFGTVTRAQARVGKNAAAAVLGCSGAIGAPRWTQTAGPAVALESDKTQTISFDPPSAGTYAFDVAFTDPRVARARRRSRSTWRARRRC